MNYYPFAKDGRWFKGNLHCHSTVSDGMYSLEELKSVYKKNGYSFIVYSDHNIYTYHPELSDNNFLAYPGVEFKAKTDQKYADAGENRCYHLCALRGSDEYVAKNEGAPFENKWPIPVIQTDEANFYQATQNCINECRSRGNLVTLNHPVWSRLLLQDVLSLNNYFAIEIFNTSSALDGHDNGVGVLLWDALLRRGRKVWGVATDDNHNKDKFSGPVPVKIDENNSRWDSCSGWVCVKADGLTSNKIGEALEAGTFYSSTGPEIFRYEICEGTVIVETSKVRSIVFITYERRGFGITDPKSGLNSGSYKLKGDEQYVRVECTDFEGRKAWTNPIFLENYKNYLNSIEVSVTDQI